MKKEREFYHISLKLILKNDAGEILALKDKEGGTLAGLYDLPGGRIDTDEFKTPFPEIIQRETQEEIGDVDIKLNPAPQAARTLKSACNAGCEATTCFARECIHVRTRRSPGRRWKILTLIDALHG